MATALIEMDALTDSERRDRVSAATKAHKRELDELARLDKERVAAEQAALELATVFLDADTDEVEEARANIYRHRRVVDAARTAVHEQQVAEIEAWNALCMARMR